MHSKLNGTFFYCSYTCILYCKIIWKTAVSYTLTYLFKNDFTLMARMFIESAVLAQSKSGLYKLLEYNRFAVCTLLTAIK